MNDGLFPVGAVGASSFGPAAVRNLAKRRALYSWMMALKPTTFALSGTGGGTEFMCLDIPDDFYAVRAGFMNITGSTFAVSAVKAVGSAPTSSYVVPVDEDGGAILDSEWSSLTFAMAGANDDRIVTAAGAPTAITVAATATDAATGTTDNPAWTMTDWVPCLSRGASPTTGMRRLMIRALVPSSQTVTYNAFLIGSVWPDFPISQNYLAYHGGRNNNLDYVTSPATGANLTNSGNTVLTGAGPVIGIVQVLTNKGVLQGMHDGDSTYAGTGTTGGVYTMALISAITLGNEYLGEVPVSNVCAATGGTPSSVFFPRFATLLPIVKPSYALLPGWTSNDIGVGSLTPDELLAHFTARQRYAINLCIQNDVVPIISTPWGLNTITASYLAVWRQLRQNVFDLASQGVPIVDAFGQCGNVATANYLPGMDTGDGLHPSDRANLIGANALMPVIKGIAGF